MDGDKRAQRIVSFWRIMKKLILVIGMHRSGTSLLTQIISRLGAYLGETYELEGAASSNEDGHFEFIKVRQLHDEILHLYGKTWCDADTYGLDLDSTKVNEYKQRLANELNYLFEKHDIVAIKDPRIVFFLPLWKTLIEEKGINPIYIYAIRRASEVAESLYRRDGISVEYGIRLWNFYNVLIQHFLVDEQYLRVSFDELFGEGIADKLCDFCGLSNGITSELDGVVKTKLRHNKANGNDESKSFSVSNQLYNQNISKEELTDLYSTYSRCYKDKNEIKVKREELLDLLQTDNREIVIYGAGEYGKKTASMLRDFGVFEFIYCDRDTNKQDSYMDGRKVISLQELSKKRHVIMIIAIGNKEIADELLNYFLWLEDVKLCSFKTLQDIWQNLKKSI